MSHSISITQEIELDICTTEIANKIAALGSDEQALFFNVFFRTLRGLCNDSPMGHHWQLSMIADDLFADVKEDMKKITDELSP